MRDFSTIKNEFLRKVILKIEENLSDEHFGVSELAEAVDMSRSNLLRRVKNITSLSVSQLIRQVRLQKAREILKDNSLTVSEVSHSVGFNSTSYFIKCFKDEYGYPPGELGRMEEEEIEVISTREGKIRKVPVQLLLTAIVLALVVFIFIWFRPKSVPEFKEKSIAVLPFQNDSNDSSNVYIINGLMQAILNDLQKIKDLKVVSRTSVEKFRQNPKTIREIAEELDVKYFVEGSGQKIGDQIVLTVQLIEAPNDQHIWSERYNRKAENIFQLQTDVAKSIAEQIEVIITPEEEQRIDKIPTDDLIAYDYYLKGLEYSREETHEGLYQAIDNFEKAIAQDKDFAHAYAYIAICYYFLDIYQTNKQYYHEINTYADKAILLDPELPESMISKALFYMQDEQYELAVEFLEKVLEYSPNSGWVSNFLSDIYTTRLPNTEKYLEHALRASQLNMGSQDSMTASFTYLHLSNALAQTGFLKEAEKNIKRSLAYNPNNLFSKYVYAYILLGQHGDLENTKQLLLETLAKDTTRIDIIQEVAKVLFYLGDYHASMRYYDDFIALKEARDLDIYQGENAKIAYAMEKVGRTEESKVYFTAFKLYADNDDSIYKSLMLSAYYANQGETERSMQYLKAFSEQENYQFWIVLFLREDPLMKGLKDHPEFDQVMDKIDNKFWMEHKRIRAMLEGEGLL
ncbi:helix-turn-helix domain-containing protein [Fulvivirgaceae bacterium BMA10]|uniref:Helix-turn-helix domain-containing protein n=1 Tax=Splendidivirga corallicola TaxID=3051826 RepID=A0ABT8KV70_9BACT|nr:helix-turn-helix domain-containing protein [Fulvivirgaceae bacterium BMA10]